jgi:hypothetical protein
MTAAAKTQTSDRNFRVPLRFSPEAIAAIDQAKANAERKLGFAVTDQSIGEQGFRAFCEKYGVHWPDRQRNLRRVTVRAVRRARSS